MMSGPECVAMLGRVTSEYLLDEGASGIAAQFLDEQIDGNKG